ncbi:MAG: hypothetical protein IKK34_14435 [Clostridia bacterium]|nr:hypothetical protein [Clostridia bacterium]
MPEFDLLPRGVLQGTVERMLLDRATQPESRALLEEVLRVIKGMPAANAVQVVHAHWRSDTWCSHCGAVKLYSPDNRKSNLFCHMCAAKMDGGEG